MKKLLLFVCLTVLCGGCVDRDYDLGKIEGDFCIGTEHPWEIPLATITISLDEFRNDASDIQQIFDEVDVWIPSTLPGNADYVDIERLADANDPSYMDEVLTALFSEIDDDSSSKVDDVAELLHSQYREYFQGLPDDEEGFIDAFKTSFRGSGPLTDEVRDATQDICSNFLNNINFETINFSSELGLDSGTIDMFAKNLDPQGTQNPVSAAYLYGSVTSGLPVSFDVEAQFTNSGTAIPQFSIQPGAKTDIPDTRFLQDDIESIADTFSLEIDFAPRRYYPTRGFDTGQTVSLKINLRKTGGLTF